MLAMETYFDSLTNITGIEIGSAPLQHRHFCIPFRKNSDVNDGNIHYRCGACLTGQSEIDVMTIRLLAIPVLAFVLSVQSVSICCSQDIGAAADIIGSRGGVFGVDMMDTRNFSLLDYRRILVNGETPTAEELCGRWRGVNKGIVTLVGYGQFVKEIGIDGEACFGDNVQVHQVSAECLRALGWQPKIAADGLVERRGKFQIRPANGRGPFGHAATFSYRDGGNPKSDAVRLIVDKVVKVDENHLLGRATARFGLIDIPLAYFMLERIE